METVNRQNYGALRLTKNARPLGELLPLETPLSLMIDPSNVCTFKCVFCPTGDDELLRKIGRPKGLMSLELFRKVIDGLGLFPNECQVLHLYKDGEPLVNKSLEEMVRYAKQSGRVRRIETTTNGSLLTPERSERLIDAGIDGIRISIYSLNDSGYLSTTGTPAKFERIRKNVEDLYSLKLKASARQDLHIHCKIVDTGMSDEMKNQFLDTFSPISDSVHIDSIMGWSNSLGRDFKLGLAPASGMLGELRSGERKACSEPFMKLAVNHDGTVSVCCVDWAHDTVVGDTNVETLFQIWHGEKLKSLRLKHLSGRRTTIGACNSCDYIRGLAPHTDFDHLTDRLLPIYSDQ